MAPGSAIADGKRSRATQEGREPRTVADSGGHFADFVISSGQVGALLQLDQIIGNGLLKYLDVITVQQDLAALPLICPAAKDEATNGLLLDAIFLADQTPIFFQAPLDQFVEEQNLLCQQRTKNLNPAAWDQAALLKKVINASPLLKEQHEQVFQHFDMNDPVKVADLAAGLSTADRGELQAVLEEQDLSAKIDKVTQLLQRDLSMVKLQSEVKSRVEEKVMKEQKQKILMDQMRQIQKELGIEKDEKQTLTTQFRDALKEKEVPEEVQKVIDTEIAKLNSLEPSSPEFNVCRTYLEWLTCLPWGKFTCENRDIKKAESILDEDHYGLEDVKERILEHIAVSFLKDSTQGKIMCLVGPPGVGKTSVGKSVAHALGRKLPAQSSTELKRKNLIRRVFALGGTHAV
ncbi:unnamed protein product [Cladocopium goreaui]|uniref:Lon protease homolog, mitochondrial n=1 Tax=Cladocopium goreaui TaxID=2562237 RepID=A0A9P1DEN1_9DINO|nr:unnamed protein product [Cladocopium goreaui]